MGQFDIRFWQIVILVQWS